MRAMLIECGVENVALAGFEAVAVWRRSLYGAKCRRGAEVVARRDGA